MPTSDTTTGPGASTSYTHGPHVAIESRGASQVPKTLGELQSRLREFLRLDDETAPRELIAISMDMTNAEAAGCFHYEVDTTGETPESLVTIRDDEDGKNLREVLIRVADETRRAQRVVVQRNGPLVVIAVPVDLEQRDSSVLAVALELPHGDVEPFVYTLQMLAAQELVRAKSRFAERLEWQATISAGLVELVAELQQSGDVNQACVVVANRLRDLLRCEHVAVASVPRKQIRGVRLRAISGRTTFDPRGETARAFKSAMDETLVRGEMTCWPPRGDADRAATLAHHSLADDLRTNGVVSALLESHDHRIIAVIVLCSIREETNDLVQFARAASPYLGAALDVMSQRGGPKSWTLLKRIRRRTVSRWRAAMMIGTALVMVMAMPIPHRIECTAKVEPTSRRHLVAPHDGVLEESFVRPGDTVKCGDLLAQMDGREIRWEMAGAVADRERAAKQRDKSLSQKLAADMQMAALEVERLDMKIKLLQHRQRNLDIRAAVDGIVLSGDLDGVRGAPVTTGQSLFELAPLDSLKLNAMLGDEDIEYAGAGMEVVAYLDAIPNQQLRGTVTRIHPQAEVVEGSNSFMMEVKLSGTNEELRPGMRGSVQVIGPRRALGWILFHRPFQRLRTYLRW